MHPFSRNLYAAASSMSKEGEREREGLSVQLYTQSGMGSICQIDFVQKYGWLANISVLVSVTIDILSFPINSFFLPFFLNQEVSRCYFGATFAPCGITLLGYSSLMVPPPTIGP